MWHYDNNGAHNFENTSYFLMCILQNGGCACVSMSGGRRFNPPTAEEMDCIYQCYLVVLEAIITSRHFGFYYIGKSTDIERSSPKTAHQIIHTCAIAFE